MKNLDTLGILYGTDKSSKCHDYLNIYENYLGEFRNKPLKFFEIGVFNGSSTRMWEDYFTNATLYAMDINSNMIGRTACITGDQTNRNDLARVIKRTGSLDIIIDDGAHTMVAQQVSLGFLFKYLLSGGIYIIEDLYTSYRWRRKYNKERNRTTLDVLVGLKNTGKILSDIMDCSESRYIENNLRDIEILKGRKSEVAIIIKR